MNDQDTNRFTRFFRFAENGATFRQEISGGATTFLAMSYIIFVQPGILSQAGMDFNSVMVATCLSAALGTLVMGLAANYPIALAPGMGENFFFTFSVVLGMGLAWPEAMSAVFYAGVLFLLLTVLGAREAVLNVIPDSLKMAMAAGIGLLIIFIGLNNAGIVTRSFAEVSYFGGLVSRPVLLALAAMILTAIFVAVRLRGAIVWGILIAAGGAMVLGLAVLGDYTSQIFWLALGGTGLTAILVMVRIPGAILLGILATALGGLGLGLLHIEGIVSAPPSIAPTLFKLNFAPTITAEFLTIVFVFLFMDMFDTIGTLVGVSERAGFLKDGKLPRAGRALMADSVGTVGGALLGTSTVTSFIESSAGIKQGARTGFSNIIVAAGFLLALFFSPLVGVIGKGVEVAEGVFLNPVTAPALIVVGSFMLAAIGRIKWDNLTESLPAFLVIVGIPLTFMISDGLAFGFIAYPILKLVTGKPKEVHWILYLIAVLCIIRYAFCA